jgi:antirestriction protein ArdC
MAKQSVYEIVTNQVIEAMEQGVVPWAKPWTAAGAHQNIEGRKYRGLNPLLLEISAMTKGFDQPYWMTMNQAGKKGGKVIKGSKSTIVTFYKVLEKENKEGELEQTMLLRYFKVFNIEQVEGLDWKPPVLPGTDLEPVEIGEKVIAEMPNAPEITIKESNQAYYRPSTDQVVLPQLEQYGKAEDFYRVAFHELAHSTGHESRIGRGLKNGFGSEKYAKEELIAELTSAMICQVTGIEAEIEQTAAYIAGWKKALTDDPKLIVSASSAAQKAADYILNENN